MESKTMSEIALGHYGDRTLDANALKKMYILRHAVFHDRLGWDVLSDRGMEHDFFDVLNPIYVLAKGDGAEIQGCLRLLPTTGSYMLKDVFPQLLHGRPAPECPSIWELSRFALSKSKSNTDQAISSFGIRETSIRMLQSVVHFAFKNSIKCYVLVTTVAIERLLHNLGLDVCRFGPPLRIGNTMAVACWFDVNSHTESLAFGRSPQLDRAAA
jgi:acyl homoserine lactone synthase